MSAPLWTVDAINKVKLNHYLMKPWEPPEQNLYPILVDQLEDWRAGYQDTFDGTYIVGSRWAPETHRLKDFLSRLPGFKQITKRFIAGENIDDAIIAIRELNALGITASFDHLGESISSSEEAETARRYLDHPYRGR